MRLALRDLWQRHGLMALLSGAGLASLIAIGFETGWGQGMRLPLPMADNPSRTSDLVATLPGFSLAPLDSAFTESGERPLFTPTRRPAAVNTASAPAMKRGQFKLSGTSIHNDLTVAFLVEVATGKTIRTTQGQEINGMKLDTVEPNRAVLKLGDETEELVLRTAASPPAPKVAVPAPGIPPAGPGVPVPVAQPQPAIAAQPVPRPALPQTAIAPNQLVPAPGSSQLPGFVMVTPTAPAASQAAPSPDAGTPAQRRRRNQTSPQQ